jgi:hypothetical protein
MIDTREELLNALCDAAELEHNLACLYLFAAFSIKDSAEEIPDPVLRAQVRGWQGAVLKIAKQEMGHLGTVCNLLTAIGGAPHFERPNFPQPAGYYSPDIPFLLEAFSLTSLQRFVEFERHHDAPGVGLEAVAPEPVPFRHVGELYTAIRDAFATLDEAWLFIGPNTSQDSSWSLTAQVHEVRNRAEAVAALDDIILEGEGTATPGPQSHYQTFVRIFNELKAMPGFEPARPVIANPATRRHRDARRSTIIPAGTVCEIAELFNIIYQDMLRLLTQYYAYAGETAEQRSVLQMGAVTIMVSVLRPLGVELTRLEAGPAHPGQTAGAGFEIYGPLHAAVQPRLSWRIIAECLEHAATEANRLSQVTELDPRTKGVLTDVKDAVSSIAADLRTELPNLPPA